MIILLGAWWDLHLCRIGECGAALEAKVRANKTDVIVDSEELFAVPSVVRLEGLLPFLVQER